MLTHLVRLLNEGFQWGQQSGLKCLWQHTCHNNNGCAQHALIYMVWPAQLDIQVWGCSCSQLRCQNVPSANGLQLGLHIPAARQGAAELGRGSRKQGC